MRDAYMLVRVESDYTGQGQPYPIGIYSSRERAVRAFRKYMKDWLKNVSELTAYIMKDGYKKDKRYMLFENSNSQLYLVKVNQNQEVLYGDHMSEEVLKKGESKYGLKTV